MIIKRFHKNLFTERHIHNNEMLKIQTHLAEIKMDRIRFFSSKMPKVRKQILLRY